ETTKWCIRVGIAGSTDDTKALCPKDCNGCITSYVIHNQGRVAIYVEAGFQANSKRIERLKPKWSQSFSLPRYADNGGPNLSFTFNDDYCLVALLGFQIIGCMDKCYPKNGQPVDNPWSQAKYGADQPSTDEPTIGNGPIGVPDTGGGNNCPKVISFDMPLDLQASNSEVFATDETSLQTIQPPDTNPSDAIAINAFYDPGTTHAFGDETIESSSIEKTDQELIGPIVTASNLVIPQYDDNSSSETNPFFIHDWKLWGKMRRSARDFHSREDSIRAIGTRGF
ncbi:hypothetical protein MMC22_009314, partial [Lobaria immixta]|nr:hypothetical protein [Lobaria immixta]